MSASDTMACAYDDAGHCATCSDEALEAVVLRVDGGGMAQRLRLVLRPVALGERFTEIDVSLIDELAEGDRLLIHGGVALAKL